MSEIDLSFLDRHREDAIEFFNWPGELVDCMFKYSKEIMDNPWKRFYPDKDAVDDFYKCPFYLLRQLSYSKQFGSMDINQQSRNECNEIIKNKSSSTLEIGCGNGDLSMYLNKHGVNVIVTEHTGCPIQFLKWRFAKYNTDIKILSENDELPESVENIVCNSVLDHLWDNISFTRKLCSIAKGKIYARPNIGIEYAEKRPETHAVEILKTVPDCFKLIEEHNKLHG